MAQTKREYAISLGLAQPTRGRMSREAHAAIADAEAKGMTFADTAVARRITSSVNADPLPAEVPTEHSGVNGDTPTPPTLRQGYLPFVKENGGTLKVHANEGCENCHDSFTFCHCSNPTFRFWKTDEVYTLAA